MAKADLTAARLRALLHYDPETGIFTWRVARPRAPLGSVAGCAMIRGNYAISVDNHRYSAHRLAFLYMTGQWPIAEVDHCDVNPLNNRWDNLRDATSGQNKQNKRRPTSANKCGFLGVYLHCTNRDGRQIWRTRIQVNGAVKHIGLFNSPQEAHAAYIEAKRQYHPFGTL